MEVAVAVIWRKCGGPAGNPEVLLTRRPAEAHLGGCWEHPGGKVAPGESAEQAARRETLEETGLTLGWVEPLITIEHAYPDRTVRIHAMLAEVGPAAAAVPGPMESRWVKLTELSAMDLPPANGPITAAAGRALSAGGRDRESA